MLFPSLLLPSCQSHCSPCGPGSACNIGSSVNCEFDLVYVSWSTQPETGATYRLTGPGLDIAVSASGSRTETYSGAAEYTISTYIGGELIRECSTTPDVHCGCPVFIEGTVRTNYTASFDVESSGAGCGNCDDLRCPDLSGAFGVGAFPGACRWSGGPFGNNISCFLEDFDSRVYAQFNVELTVTQLHPETGLATTNWYAIVGQNYPVLDLYPDCIGAVGGWKLLGPESAAPFHGDLLIDTYTQVINSGTMCVGTIEVS